MKPATAKQSAWPDIVRAELAVLARGYAAILFCSTPAVGIAFAAATFVVPGVGAAGLLGIVTAHLAGRALRFPQTGVHLYNALLVGLGLGFSYSLNFYLAPLIMVAAAFSIFVAQALASWAWRVGRLPVLSVPFVLTVWLIAPALPSLSHLTPLTHAPVSALLIGPEIDGFLIALGAFLFVPHPIAGLVLLAGVLWSSRVLALMAAAGYAAGAATLHVLGAVTIDPAARRRISDAGLCKHDHCVDRCLAYGATDGRICASIDTARTAAAGDAVSRDDVMSAGRTRRAARQPVAAAEP